MTSIMVTISNRTARIITIQIAAGDSTDMSAVVVVVNTEVVVSSISVVLKCPRLNLSISTISVSEQIDTHTAFDRVYY